jgi:hypothetical protein
VAKAKASSGIDENLAVIVAQDHIAETPPAVVVVRNQP